MRVETVRKPAPAKKSPSCFNDRVENTELVVSGDVVICCGTDGTGFGGSLTSFAMVDPKSEENMRRSLRKTIRIKPP